MLTGKDLYSFWRSEGQAITGFLEALTAQCI